MPTTVELPSGIWHVELLVPFNFTVRSGRLGCHGLQVPVLLGNTSVGPFPVVQFTSLPSCDSAMRNVTAETMSVVRSGACSGAGTD